MVRFANKLPRVTLRGENLYVEGEEEPYFRDPESTIRLRVDALTIYRGYEPEDPIKLTGKVLTESLHGIAKLEGGDRLAVIGIQTDTRTPIEFSLWPVADTEAKFHWRSTIGFQPLDWKRERENGFWIAGNCTRQYLDDVLAAVRRGQVDTIFVGMQTTLWTKDKAILSERAWHVAPSTNDRESTRPAFERGNISSLTWEEKFGLHLAKPNDDVTAPRPQLVELPARIYSMLSALIAIGVALLVLTFLQH